MLTASLAIAVIASFPLLRSGTAQTPTASSGGGGSLATPAATMAHGQHGSDHGTSGHTAGGQAMHDVPYDLFYIDMMIPHHESVIALAEVARHELTHPALIAMAESIVATQGKEIEQLRQWRDAWYPDADPVSMDAMMQMPGLESAMDGMHEQMSSDWQVQAFCAAENRDLAFIDQVIPHHEMAVVVSEAAPEMAEHAELKELAAAVIDAQQAEIELLKQIRAELTGGATPEV